MSPGDVNFIISAITTNKGSVNSKQAMENAKSMVLLSSVIDGCTKLMSFISAPRYHNVYMTKNKAKF